MDEFVFIWDEIKNFSNHSKHGIFFSEAQTVFADELARLIKDPDHSVGEARFILMGMSAKFRLLVVCHCERKENVIRIISARKANRKERKQYEKFKHA